jgi:hypothetical protein
MSRAHAELWQHHALCGGRGRQQLSLVEVGPVPLTLMPSKRNRPVFAMWWMHGSLKG